MEYRLKVISPLGTYRGKDTQEWDDAELEEAKASLKNLVSSAAAFLSIDTDEHGYCILGSEIVKNSIICIELAE